MSLPKTVEALDQAIHASKTAGELVALYKAFRKKGAKVFMIQTRWKGLKRGPDFSPHMKDLAYMKDPAKNEIMKGIEHAAEEAYELDPATPLDQNFWEELERGKESWMKDEPARMERLKEAMRAYIEARKLDPATPIDENS
jgi:hypothetical protein